MNRIDFEDWHYPGSMARNGDAYKSRATQAKWEAWCAALECARREKSWRVRRLIVRAAKGGAVLAAALFIGAEIYVMAHFAIKFW